MSMLEYRNKFNVDNPKRSTAFSEDQFFRWTAGNFYRTSYNDMRSKVRSRH